MTIETDRLLLRPFQKRDAEDVYEYLRKPAVHCFESMKVTSVEEAKRDMVRRSKDGDCTFAIVLKETGKVVGEIDAAPEESNYVPNHLPPDTFRPCWMLNESYQGYGYAYEAAHAFFGYLFKEKAARRICAYTEDYNFASQRLCEKLGMRREGLFREFVSFVNDSDGMPLYENTYQYAILKKEWR